MHDACAIDFGTSNSAIAIHPGEEAATDQPNTRLVELEPGHLTMPTAVFYAVEGLAPHEPPARLYGRAAVAAYVEGVEGRLMRSMKSILGSTLAEQSTDVGAGRSVRYLDVVGGYLAHLKGMAEAQAGRSLTRVVMGRPVYFVDGDPERDARAQAALEAAARSVGFAEVQFQFEPIAAALDYESTVQEEQCVLVADIGGGTSDFSLVRVGPQRRARVERRDDILGNHGVHVAGTDFDRHLELARILPACGYRSHGPDGREVPSRIYFDLATWHLINTCYSPARLAEVRRLRTNFSDLRLHERLLAVLQQRLGHALIARAEAAKIAVAEGGATRIELDLIEPGLAAELHEADAVAAIAADLQRIVDAADETLAQAGLPAQAVDALYFTGGSTGLAPLAQAIAARFPRARVMRGDRFASVARGLGLQARRVFARAA
jgi:hypothetical chaperone protein